MAGVSVRGRFSNPSYSILKKGDTVKKAQPLAIRYWAFLLYRSNIRTNGCCRTIGTNKVMAARDVTI